MSEPRKSRDGAPCPAPEWPADAVYCRRLLRVLPVCEHEKCSYCFGTAEDIATGDHARFCDFEAGKDPICFGFPEGHPLR